MSLTSLKKIKEPPLRGEQYSIKERSGEISGLREQKTDLSMEIKRLKRAKFDLIKEVGFIKREAEENEKERIQEIDKALKEASIEIEKKSNRLEERTIQLDKRELFLTELYEYLDSYAQTVGSVRLLNERRGVLLKKRYQTSIRAEKTIKKRNLIARESLRNAKRTEELIDMRYEKADKIATWFEREADNAEKELELKEKDLALREKKLRAGRKHIKIEHGKLITRQRRVRDQELSLRTKMV